MHKAHWLTVLFGHCIGPYYVERLYKDKLTQTTRTNFYRAIYFCNKSIY